MEPRPYDINNYSESQLLSYYSEAIHNGYSLMDLKSIDIGTSQDTISGYVFNRLNVDIIAKNGNTIFRQIIYLKCISEHILEVVISYDNPEDKKVLLDAFLNSSFSKI